MSESVLATNYFDVGCVSDVGFCEVYLTKVCLSGDVNCEITITPNLISCAIYSISACNIEFDGVQSE